MFVLNTGNDDVVLKCIESIFKVNGADNEEKLMYPKFFFKVFLFDETAVVVMHFYPPNKQ